MLSDVARPRHTDPLARPQLGQSDGRDVGGRHQTRPQVQLAADPELVHHAHYLENYHNLLTLWWLHQLQPDQNDRNLIFISTRL